MRLRKTIFILVFIIPLFAFSQKTSYTKINITKAQLQDAKKIQDIVSTIPIDCHVITFEITVNLGNGITTTVGHGDSIPAGSLLSLQKIKKGKWFFIEVSKWTCPNPKKSSFQIFVD